jgi:hypothetical protein
MDAPTTPHPQIVKDYKVPELLMERTVPLPDRNTLAELEVMLQRKLRGQVHDLRVVPRGQGVALQGYTYTYYAKQLAQHALMDATSHPLLSNEIDVV